MRMLGLREVVGATEEEGRGWWRQCRLGFQELRMSGHIFGKPGWVPEGFGYGFILTQARSGLLLLFFFKKKWPIKLKIK